MREAIKVSKADGASILFYDSTSQFFSSDALTIPGPEKELERYTTTARPNQGVASIIVKTQRIHTVEDIDATEGVSPIARKKGRRAFVGIPLRAFETDLGVLFLHWNKPHKFTALDKTTFELIAKQAALTTFAAKQYEEVNRAHSLTQAVGSAVAAIETCESIKAAMLEVARQAHGLIHSSTVSNPTVTILFEDADHAAQSIRTDGIRIISVPRPRVNEDSTVPASTSLEVQLTAETEELGSLILEADSTAAFSESDKRSIRFFASQVASSLRRAQQQRKLERLGNLLLKLSFGEIGPPPKVGKSVTDGAVELFRASTALLFSYDSAARRVSHPPQISHSAEDRPLGPEDPARFNIHRHVLAAASNQLLALEIPDSVDLDQSLPMERERALLADMGYQHLIAFNLGTGADIVGVLVLLYKVRSIFTSFDEQLLRQYCYHSSHLIKKSLLVRDLQATKATAEKVSQIQTLEDLDTALANILRVAQDILRADVITLYRYDFMNRVLITPPASLGVLSANSLTTEAASDPGSILNAVLLKKQVFLVPKVKADPIFCQSMFAQLEGVESCACLPLSVDGSTYGIMFLSYRKQRSFSDADTERMQWFASQAGIALKNFDLYHKSQETNRALTSLLAAGKAVFKDLRTDNVLMQILDHALALLPPSKQSRFIAYVALLKDKRQFEVIAVRPRRERTALNAAIGSIDLESSESRVGVLGRCVLRRQTIIVSDVRRSDDYISAVPGMRSQLAVPLIVDDQVLGAIGIEDTQEGSFSETYADSIELLSSQAALAIINAQRFEALQQIKGRIGTKTALAWLGMASSTLGHRIHGQAATIRDQAKYYLEHTGAHDNRYIPTSLTEVLRDIIDVAEAMLEQPIIPPLDQEDGSELIDPAMFISSRIRQLEERPSYQHIQFHIDHKDEGTYGIRINRLWFRQALDILLENSRVAMATKTPRESLIKICTWSHGQRAYITILDSGPGIGKEVRKILFKQPIPKKKRDRGMGMGLLLAELIAETYGGSLLLDESVTNGACFQFSFPIETTH